MLPRFLYTKTLVLEMLTSKLHVLQKSCKRFNDSCKSSGVSPITANNSQYVAIHLNTCISKQNRISCQENNNTNVYSYSHIFVYLTGE